MDNKLLGLILQGDKKNKEEFNQIKKAVDRASNGNSSAIVSASNGESIVVSDSAEGTMKSLRVFGKSEQLTTTGANLLDMSDAKGGTNGGITVTVNDDGSLTYSGTSESTAINVWLLGWFDRDTTDLNNILFTLPAGEYRVKGCVLYSGTTALGSHSVTSAYGVISIDADTPITAIRAINVAVGSSVNTTIYPMLCKGSTLLPYEPYTGGMPSPNPQYPQEIISSGDDGNVGVDVYGGNLLDITKFNIAANGGTITEGGVTLTIVNNEYVTVVGTSTSYPQIWQFIYLPNGVYVLSGCDYMKNLLLRARIMKNGTRFDYGYGEPFEITDDVDTVQIMIQADKGWVVDTVIKPMLNKGATPLPYEPYRKQPLTIPTPNGLPGIKVTDPSIATYTDADGQMWCADEIDFERGVYVKRIEKIALTKSNCARVDVLDNYTLVSFRTAIVYDTDEYISRRLFSVSNKFLTSVEYAPNYYRAATINDSGWKGEVRVLVCVDKSITTINDFINVIGDDCFVMVPLKTPIETPLSESELNTYKALYTNYPTTTILNDSGAYMEVKYTADKKNYIDNKFAQITNAVLSMGSNI